MRHFKIYLTASDQHLCNTNSLQLNPVPDCKRRRCTARDRLRQELQPARICRLLLPESLFQIGEKQLCCGGNHFDRTFYSEALTVDHQLPAIGIMPKEFAVITALPIHPL